MRERDTDNPTSLPDEVYFAKCDKLEALICDLEKILLPEDTDLTKITDYILYVEFYPIDRLDNYYTFPEQGEMFGFELSGEIQDLDCRFFECLKKHVDLDMLLSFRLMNLTISGKIHSDFASAITKNELSYIFIYSCKINYLPSNLFDPLNLEDRIDIGSCTFNKIEDNTLSLLNVKMFDRILFYTNTISDGSTLTIKLPDRLAKDPESVHLENNTPPVSIQFAEE